MTAIAGYWSFDGTGDPGRQCERMLRAQQVYGPHGSICRAGSGISVGRTLYRLLPEDRFDRGPVTGAGGTRLLVADLRLDNRDELCSELGIASGEASSLADSAVLMKALERWGDGTPERLVGDFAFALWDEPNRRLLLVRDVGSQRPLHYHRGRGFFAFASMPKGLHALPQIPPAPNRQAMANFLALMPEEGQSYFEGIETVPSGHVAIVTRDGVSTRRYWDPPRRELRLRSREEYYEGLREQLDRAVACRLRGADGAVAAHLSAGLDSSSVAATAARLLAPSGGSVTAYTSVPREGFTGRGVRNSFADEGRLAAEVAAMYPNMEHVLVHGSGRSPFESLERNFFLYERPFLNLCNGVWVQEILDRAKARGLKVLLNGQMGNMTFSYDGMMLLPQMLRRGRLLRLSRLLRDLRRNRARIGTLASATIGPFLPMPLWQMVRRLRGRAADISGYSAINPKLVESSRLKERAAELGLDTSYRPRQDPHQARCWVYNRVDLGNYVKGELGGWGIDVRDPSADKRLFEFCLSVPLELYIDGGVRRSLVRNAFADRLPPGVRNERLKGYQAADWHEGLTAGRAQLAEEIERMAAVPLAEEALDLPRMRRLVDEWPEGDWNDDRVLAPYRLALLRGVSGGHFIRKAAGSNQ